MSRGHHISYIPVHHTRSRGPAPTPVTLSRTRISRSVSTPPRFRNMSTHSPPSALHSPIPQHPSSHLSSPTHTIVPTSAPHHSSSLDPNVAALIASVATLQGDVAALTTQVGHLVGIVTNVQSRMDQMAVPPSQSAHSSHYPPQSSTPGPQTTRYPAVTPTTTVFEATQRANPSYTIRPIFPNPHSTPLQTPHPDYSSFMPRPYFPSRTQASVVQPSSFPGNVRPPQAPQFQTPASPSAFAVRDPPPHLSPHHTVNAPISAGVHDSQQSEMVHGHEQSFHRRPLPNPDPEDTEENGEVVRPERFFGDDPTKLRHFVRGCTMYFDGKPSKFQTDRLRVNFGASLLSGQAMDWWDTVIVEEPPSPIRMNWDLFVQHLVQLFGERDMPRKAARELRELKMGHNDKITRYLISFAKIAPFTGWNDPALLFQFYEGLPDRLKDALCKVGYPATLSALQTLAIDFDGFYWDRERERRRTFPPAIPNATYRPPPP